MLSFEIERTELKLRERPKPKLRPGWALVRLRLAGICNTDVELLRGYYDFHGVPGHEFVGEVVGVESSRAAARRWIGRRVCGEINIACRSLGPGPVCDFCRRGAKSHCRRRTVLGILGQPGAFAEFLTLPIENLHPVPAGVGDQEAVFVEPLAAACRILEQVDTKKLSRAAVLGDGKLGQLVALVLKTAVREVELYGKHEKKLAIASRQGVEAHRIRGDHSDLEQVRRSFPLVVEATGSPSGLALAAQMTEPCGILVLKSTFHGTAQIESWPLVVREIRVLGSRCGPFGRALQLLEKRKVDPLPLIARTFPLREAVRAIEYAQKPGVLKVLLSGESPGGRGADRS